MSNDRSTHETDTRSEWDAGNVTYQGFCTCGWKSEWFENRKNAFKAGTDHLING